VRVDRPSSCAACALELPSANQLHDLRSARVRSSRVGTASPPGRFAFRRVIGIPWPEDTCRRQPPPVSRPPPRRRRTPSAGSRAPPAASARSITSGDECIDRITTPASGARSTIDRVASDAAESRHRYVHQNDVGLKLLRQIDGLQAVRRGADTWIPSCDSSRRHRPSRSTP